MAHAVNVEDPFPFSGGKIRDQTAKCDAGIVHQKIDLSVGLHGAAYETVCIFFQRQVRHFRFHGSTLLQDPLFGALQIGGIDVRKHQFHPTAGRLLGKFKSKPVSGACDQGHFVLKLFHFNTPFIPKVFLKR